jgi:hypothetical protein
MTMVTVTAITLPYIQQPAGLVFIIARTSTVKRSPIAFPSSISKFDKNFNDGAFRYCSVTLITLCFHD